MNNVSLYGRLDSEPQLLGIPGRDVCEFWLKVHGRLDKQTLYVKVIAFRALAERLAEQLGEGDSVAVSGHLRSQRWPGSRRLYVHTVLARDVQLAGSRSGGGRRDCIDQGCSSIMRSGYWPRPMRVHSGPPEPAGSCLLAAPFCPVGSPRKVAELPSPRLARCAGIPLPGLFSRASKHSPTGHGRRSR